MLDEVGEGVVEVAGLLLKDAKGDFDAGGAEFCDSLAADEGVGIFGGDDDAGDSGGDEGVGAGAGAAVVAAGLEGDVGGCAAGGDVSRCGLFEGDDLGVVAVVVEVCAFADDFCPCLFDEDAAYLRVGGSEGGGFGGRGVRARCMKTSSWSSVVMLWVVPPSPYS